MEIVKYEEEHKNFLSKEKLKKEADGKVLEQRINRYFNVQVKKLANSHDKVIELDFDSCFEIMRYFTYKEIFELSNKKAKESGLYLHRCLLKYLSKEFKQPALYLSTDKHVKLLDKLKVRKLLFSHIYISDEKQIFISALAFLIIIVAPLLVVIL